MFFVNEAGNTAIVQAAQTITVNPRRGSQDKAPWKNLDLTEITGQTIERAHLFGVHLGETVAPYVTLEPLKALLPLKQGDTAIPLEHGGPGGIRQSGLERRMRKRWRTVSRLWEANKAPVNQLNLAGPTGLPTQAVVAVGVATETRHQADQDSVYLRRSAHSIASAR